MNAELRTLNETLKNMQKNLVAMGEQMEDVVNRIEIISVDKQKFKTEKRYARVGEKVLITNPRDDSHGVVGEIFTVSSIGVSGRIDVKEIMANNRCWAFKSDEYEVIIEPEQAPVIEEFPDELTPNEQRDELRKKARKFVLSRMDGEGDVKIDLEVGSYDCTPEFIVNTKNRMVTVLLRGYNTGKLWAKGIAKCMPDEVFNADIGKAIALARALKIEVPEEFLNAVQPDEVVVGMTIKHLESDLEGIKYSTSEVVENHNFKNGTVVIRSLAAEDATIINDTNAIYEVV